MKESHSEPEIFSGHFSSSVMAAFASFILSQTPEMTTAQINNLGTGGDSAIIVNLPFYFIKLESILKDRL